MTRASTLRRLASDRRGAAAVEFALLAPAFIVMLFGVLQVGIGLQNYNAMRSLSADVARYAMIQNARGNPQTSGDLSLYAENLGSGPPYLLLPGPLEVTVAPAAAPQINGATELTLTIEYTVPSLLAPMGLEGPDIDYERPIFLATN